MTVCENGIARNVICFCLNILSKKRFRLSQGSRKKRRGGDLDSVPSGDAQFRLFTPNTSSEDRCV